MTRIYPILSPPGIGRFTTRVAFLTIVGVVALAACGSGPLSFADSAHGLCTTGGPLSDAPGVCHPCVARVCMAIPSCCTTAWTVQCVEELHALCALC